MNPIKDNRIAIDVKFAWRLYHYLMRRKNNEKIIYADSVDLEYLITASMRLLAWQKATVVNEEELKFLADKYGYEGRGNVGCVRLNPKRKNIEQFHCHLEKENLSYIYEEAIRRGKSISEVLNDILDEERNK